MGLPAAAASHARPASIRAEGLAGSGGGLPGSHRDSGLRRERCSPRDGHRQDSIKTCHDTGDSRGCGPLAANIAAISRIGNVATRELVREVSLCGFASAPLVSLKSSIHMNVISYDEWLLAYSVGPVCGNSERLMKRAVSCRLAPICSSFSRSCWALMPMPEITKRGCRS